MWGARLGHPLRAKRVQCEINYPRKGAPAAAARSRSMAERPGPKVGAPALPDAQFLRLLLGVSTRPHSLEGLRTHSPVLRACRFPFIDQGGPWQPCQPQSHFSSSGCSPGSGEGFGGWGTGWGWVGGLLSFPCRAGLQQRGAVVEQR